MKFLFPGGDLPKDQTQSRLMWLAALFLFLYSVILSLSPVVRLHTWQVDYHWTHWIGFSVWLAGLVLIHRLSCRYLADRDPYLVPVIALLSGWGLLTVWRLDTSFGIRQSLWFSLCALVFCLIFIRSNVLVLLRRYKYLWLSGGLLLTVLTFFLGTYPGGEGPRLWLGCCGVYLQPSEPLKLLLVVYLAAYLADRSILKLNLLSLLLPTLILLGAALVLLIAQRDLGTATLFIVLYSIVVYLASGKRRLLLVSGLLILLAGVVGYQSFTVIQVRIAAWLNPWVDAGGRSYQIVQSLLAIAAGGTFGDGPGIGSPGVIPVAQSDFIFSAISEEFGLVGGLGILVLLGILAVRGMMIAMRAPNHYQRFLAAGITTYLVAQSVLIIGGNLRLLPLTGVTLPFVSYGGSSLLTSFIAAALLLSISDHPEEDAAPLLASRPYLVIGGGMLAALIALGTVAVYWGVIRADDLQERADNPRWAITERYVPRGKILDRNNEPIAVTTGTPGKYERNLLDPDLGPIIGYSNSVYGQAGLEAALDPYLRGVDGNPTSTVVFYHMIHGQTPPGLNVRLSIDLTIQKQADALLEGKSGALVLLNTQTGEILAMSSHPGFDPNQLAEYWDTWSKDSRAIFLNRASQGQYGPGAALGPFILAAELAQEKLPAIPGATSLTVDGINWDCAIPVSSKPTWGELIANGCPNAINVLAERLRPEQITQLLRNLKLDQTPQIDLPIAPATVQLTQENARSLFTNTVNLKVSPLQMALAGAVLNSQGSIPTPRISSAVETPQQGWVVLPAPTASSVPTLSNRREATQLLQTGKLPVWEVTATGLTAKGKITWFLAGTANEWKGSPLALALVLESNDPVNARTIGEKILETMIKP